MKVALAQLNPTVGDVAGNTTKIRSTIADAAGAGAELVVFAEMATVGYPPRDLLEDAALVADSAAAVEALACDCRDIAALVGFVRPAEGGHGPPLEDAAALLAGGAVRRVFVKALLPNYDVYDDPRYFRPGPGPACAEVNGRRFAVTICEDLWDPTALGRDLYGMDPIAQLAGADVDLIVNIAASGFERGKVRRREQLLARQARRSNATLLYVNQVGGNDEMVFDGGSCAVAPDGRVLARAASFREDLLLVDTDSGGRREPVAEEMPRLVEALQLGLGDYVRKAGFRGVEVALTGDAGSAVAAALAVRALGTEAVRGVAAFGRDERESLAEVRRLAERLGIAIHVVPAETVEKALESLQAAGGGHRPRAALLARLRGECVSARATSSGRLAVAGTDKTDLATGRCTPAETMPVALAPLGDVLRRDVRRLPEPLGVAGGADPPADLPGLDAGTLDEGIQRSVEGGQTVDDMVVGGMDRSAAVAVVRAVAGAERCRTSAPPLLKVTARAFGSGRRIPIARRDE
jgi:predicted amidohydrolase